MNFDHERFSQKVHQSPKKRSSLWLLKLLGAGILVFFLLFVMNKVVKKEVSSLIEQKNISSATKSLPINPNH